MGVAEVVKAAVLDPGFLTNPVPERQVRAARAGCIPGRGEDERAACARLTVQNAPGLAVERNRPRTRLAVAKGQHVAMNLRPAQVDDLSLTASGEQQKADDVGLRPAFLPGLPVQDPVQAGDLLPGQEPRELRAPVERDALRRIAFDVAAGNGEVQHLPKAREGEIGITRRGPAVAVEPAPDPGLPDTVERLRPEGWRELSRQLIPDAPPRRRLVTVEVGLLPRPRDEVPEQRDRTRRPGLSLRLGVRPAGMALPANVLHALHANRNERDALRAPAHVQQQHITLPPEGRTLTPRPATRLSHTV